MRENQRLPGLVAAREVLGLNPQEIASAVQTDPKTLYQWQQGQTPTAAGLSRLARLDALAQEIQRTIRTEKKREWLNRCIPAFEGKTPREMIVSGRSETVLGALSAINHGPGG